MNIYEQLSKLVTHSLMEELVLYPKAGLVSFMDNGSHADMDSKTFIQSIESLQSYWISIARLGSIGADFKELKQAGIIAECTMLVATNNINTHRGVIFILGILVAAVAYAVHNKLRFNEIQQVIINLWGNCLSNHQLNKTSHGSLVRDKYQIKWNIISEASQGFPNIWDNYYPQLVNYYVKYDELAKLQLFYTILATTDDTNLLFRGGIEGLNWAKQRANQFLEAGGVEHNTYIVHAEGIHQEFIGRNLSPGGCADLLSATLFLYKVRRALWV